MTTTQEAPRSRRLPHFEWQGFGFVLLGVALGGLLISAGKSVYAVQGGMAALASLLPLGYAFGAGMVATVNPCGVLLLPSLVAYYLGRGEAAELSGPQRAGKALLLGLMATLGFVTLFAVVGLIIGSGGYALAAAFPVAGLLVGVALSGLGVWLALSGRGLGILLASRAMEQVQLRDDLRSLFLFGVAYAVTSLSCTLPISGRRKLGAGRQRAPGGCWPVRELCARYGERAHGRHPWGSLLPGSGISFAAWAGALRPSPGGVVPPRSWYLCRQLLADGRRAASLTSGCSITTVSRGGKD